MWVINQSICLFNQWINIQCEIAFARYVSTPCLKSLCIGCALSSEAHLNVLLNLLVSKWDLYPCTPNGVFLCHIWQADGQSCPTLYNGLKYAALWSSFLFWELSLWRKRDPEIFSTLSHRRCLALILLLLVANVWLKSGKSREALEASCAILVQPQSQSKCKWLQVMRKDSNAHSP